MTSVRRARVLVLAMAFVVPACGPGTSVSVGVGVAYPGVGAEFSPAGPRFDNGGPYVFTTATDDWRKNLQTLRAASTEHPLLSPAELGYISPERLPALYRGASAFVYPSRFEGFGIPVIEAMACGVPCIVSSHPSLDEASGDAAVRTR